MFRGLAGKRRRSHRSALLAAAGSISLLLPCVCRAQGYTITTIAGGNANGRAPKDGGPATDVVLLNPYGLALDPSGSLFISEENPGLDTVAKIAPDGTISSIAGVIYDAGYTGDGGQATEAELSSPSGLALDSSGNLYIADRGNNRVRKISPDGIITTVAGSGGPEMPPLYGDGGPALQATLLFPLAVAVDASDNLYIADSEHWLVRKVTPDGTISTFAGTGISYTVSNGDNGPAASAVVEPFALAVAGSGNVYIGDGLHNTIRKVDTNGIITTVAGNGSQVYSGDGGPATLAGMFGPFGVTVDNAGDIYIADTGDQRVRLVTPDGKIITIAGNGSMGSSGDNGPAVSATITNPTGIVVGPHGDVYVSDQSSDFTPNGPFDGRVRKLTPLTRLLANKSAASYAVEPLAIGSIVAAFGFDLATGSLPSSKPLGTDLLGTTVTVQDSTGASNPAPLFYVSAGQVNYEIPENAAAGPATVTIQSGAGIISSAPLQLTKVSPGIFALNGGGLVAAIPVRVSANGTQTAGKVYSVVDNAIVPNPIDLGVAAGDTIVLEIFGTGIRAAGKSNVQVTIGGVSAHVSYAGPAPDNVGEDQVNVTVPTSLAGKGNVSIVVTAAGQTANTTNVTFQ